MPYYTALDNRSRVAAVAETSRGPMRVANKLQRQDPHAFIAVYVFADQLALGTRAGGKVGWCYASSNNYPGASTRLRRDDY